MLLIGDNKNTAHRRQTFVFTDGSEVSNRPTVVRAWVPRRQAPVIQYSVDWKRLSTIAGQSSWRFYFRLFPGTIRDPQMVELRKARRTQPRGRPLLIVWYGLGAHTSTLVHRWLESQDGTVHIEFLSPSAPKLNPVEQIWNYLKNREIPNLCASNLIEIGDTARRRLKSMRRRPRLVRAFWRQTELGF